LASSFELLGVDFPLNMVVMLHLLESRKPWQLRVHVVLSVCLAILAFRVLLFFLVLRGLLGLLGSFLVIRSFLGLLVLFGLLALLVFIVLFGI